MIITLCGSLRFEEDFRKWDERLTLAGHTVFTVSVYPSYKGEKNWYDEATKAKLDAAHKRKIDISDMILVLNRDGYIGDSTASEIQHARNAGKKIKYLAPDNSNSVYLGDLVCPYSGCHDPVNQRPPCPLCYE